MEKHSDMLAFFSLEIRQENGTDNRNCGRTKHTTFSGAIVVLVRKGPWDRKKTRNCNNLQFWLGLSPAFMGRM